jgi:glycosyltransferase involved in cell wall biosynthesis
MVTMPHVSVMIPVFNHARFIGRTIESVLNQQFQDIDVVVVDDTSTDNSFEVATRYCADPRVRCVRNERNLGVAKNWNRCLELARGPLVMVLGSDDLIDPDHLILVCQAFEEYAQVGLVYAPVRTVDANDRVIHEGVARPSRLYHAGDEAVAALTKGICTVTTVIRRECYERLGLFDEEIWNGPDVEFFPRIASSYDVYDLGQVHGSVRLHEGKMGYLGYLRKDLLDSYIQGSRLTWSHLSPEGLRRLGINDLEKFIAEYGARFALNGATVVIAYGRPDLVCYYLRRAAELDSHWWRRGRFWKAFGLLTVYPLSRRIIRYRMKIA